MTAAIALLAFVATLALLTWRWYRVRFPLLVPARGRTLTVLALYSFGVERRRVWWIFYESDRSLRKRIVAAVHDVGLRYARGLGAL